MNDETKEFLEGLAKTAAADQAEAAVRNLIGILYRHYCYLVEAGFSEGHALWLTASLQNVVLAGPKVQS